MSSTYTSNDLVNAIAAASKNLSARKDEVNRLNVFPVPDGDTGTNMSLTLESVVANLAKLPIGASAAEIRKAITTGALMGARGNSGVITSQILRGLCEGSNGFDAVSAESHRRPPCAKAPGRRVPCGAQARRGHHPHRAASDSAAAAKHARKKKKSAEEALCLRYRARRMPACSARPSCFPC